MRHALAHVLSQVPPLVLLVPSAAAQSRHVFVAMTTGAGPNYALVDSTTFAPTLGTTPLLIGANDAAWAHLGADLFVSRTTGSSIARASVAGTTATWSTFHAASGACAGVAFDGERDLVYTLTGPTQYSRELVALDAAPGSPTFGQVTAQTSFLAGAGREGWRLSGDGTLAAVSPLYADSGELVVVDTDPSSPAYLQALGSFAIPVGALALVRPVAVAIDPANRHVVLVLASQLGGASEVAVLDLATGAWLDHDAQAGGAQNYPLPNPTAACGELAFDGSALFVGGTGLGGWAARIAIDFGAPSAWSYAPVAAACSGTALAVSPDGTRVAFAGAAPNALIVRDASTLAPVTTVPLPATVLAVQWEAPCAAAQVYCTSGTTTHGCVPRIASSGAAVAGASSGFTISVSEVEGQRQGLIFYGVSGRLAFPWGTSSSFLCVKAPTQRTPPQFSGGTFATCTGSLAIDWSAYVFAHPGALAAPAGTRVQAQGWFRDPPSPKTTMLSDALEFEVCP